MSYLERDTVPYHDPRPPACSDEEAQRLRDLWRPSVQETWQPHYWRDSGTGEIKGRDDDYDTTKASLWIDHPMYVIPPAIAKPLNEKLAEAVDGPMFRASPDWERAVLHGSLRFMQRFLWSSFGDGRYMDKSQGQAQANFDYRGEPTGFLAQGSDKHPRVGVSAPVLERGIDHKEGEVGRIVIEDDDHAPFIARSIERQQCEGILGWTVPLAHKETDIFASSILRAKNHLIHVNWFDFPRERLSFTFGYPQMTSEGEILLAESVAELEHLVPEGTDYTNLYNYHERVRDSEFPRDVWRDTDEDRGKRQAEYDRRNADWLRSRPHAY